MKQSTENRNRDGKKKKLESEMKKAEDTFSSPCCCSIGAKDATASASQSNHPIWPTITIKKSRFETKECGDMSPFPPPILPQTGPIQNKKAASQGPRLGRGGLAPEKASAPKGLHLPLSSDLRPLRSLANELGALRHVPRMPKIPPSPPWNTLPSFYVSRGRMQHPVS